MKIPKYFLYFSENNIHKFKKSSSFPGGVWQEAKLTHA